MRYFKLIILLSISSCAFAQTLHYFNLGQVVQPDKNSCLVIKNNSKALTKIPTNLISPESISAIKLVGFNEHNYNLDSLMKGIKSLSNLNYIIFENCDLSSLEISFSNFKKLKKISILKKSTFYENIFFPLLKDNELRELCIQTNDAEIITDSLHLLGYLKSIQIGNTAFFNKSNHNTTIQIKKNNTVQNIEIAYFGDFYKTNQSESKNKMANSKKQAQTTSLAYQTKLDCIKQPIPGIHINDTTYSFSSSQEVAVTYKSGTKLTINRNSFLTQNGNPYNGIVKVFYREFRNPVEIMLSGIPMTTTVDGKIQLFKSGGMYEINAFDTQNQPLNLTSDTVIKINFALTDTSSSFKFYSLNNKGWDSGTDNITITKADTTPALQASKAVLEYYKFLNNAIRHRADTLNYMSRFYSNDYLYTYRKDNFPKDEKNKNLKDTSYVKSDDIKKKKLKTKALFRVKYLKQTKDQEIIYTIVPAKKNAIPPSYIYALFNKTFLYNGSMTKEEFKAHYGRKLLCWDVRTTSGDNTVNLDIKTAKTHCYLSGQIITLHKDRTYIVQKRSGKVLNQKVARLVNREAKEFNKKDRFRYYHLNDINYIRLNNGEEFAYKHSLNFQNSIEKKYSHVEWKIYAQALYQKYKALQPLEGYNTIGNALFNTGMGIKNIDAYIHNGSMEDIYVKYKHVPFDSISTNYATILFKSINTNFPLSPDYTDKALVGYYYKNHPNYIVRFSNNEMQVTKPNTIDAFKTLNTINIDYTNQFNVNGMNSNDITKLILD